MQDVLDGQLQANVIVFAVWEPILPTDWSQPGSRVLSRLRDSRARQYWDPDHAVARALKASSVNPECCERKGILWDLAAVYTPGAKWGATLPRPAFIEGTVVDAKQELAAAISGRP